MKVERIGLLDFSLEFFIFPKYLFSNSRSNPADFGFVLVEATQVGFFAGTGDTFLEALRLFTLLDKEDKLRAGTGDGDLSLDGGIGATGA